MGKKIDTFPDPPQAEHTIFSLNIQRWIIPAIVLASEEKIFEYVAKSPVTIEEIAEHFKVEPRAAEAIVSVAAALCFLKRLEAGRFGLTDLGYTYFDPNSPFCFSFPKNLKEDMLFKKLRDGFHGAECPNVYFNDDGRRWKYTLHLPIAGALKQQKAFKQVRKLLDVGGGSGLMSFGIAAGNPNIRCTVMDFGEVCSSALENSTRYGLEDRIDTLAADMFKDAWPPGYDAMLFANVFHCWEPDACRQLVRRAFDSLEPSGRIFICDIFLNESKDGPLTSACFSVMLLTFFRGKTYTIGELKKMLTKGGFVDFQSVHCFGEYHLISAKKP
ncbi:MAG: methyltransferase domain-containing protein [Desulfobacteraceae bacterium]|nr:methyltransferase domain-containing protein [Desulfobacteraceae bacterium]